MNHCLISITETIKRFIHLKGHFLNGSESFLICNLDDIITDFFRKSFSLAKIRFLQALP